MMKELKVGDVVHIKARVIPNPDGHKIESNALIRIMTIPSLGEFWIQWESVVHVEPRPLAVGDRVKNILSGKHLGQVKGVSEKYVWVLFDGETCPSTWGVDGLELDDSK